MGNKKWYGAIIFLVVSIFIFSACSKANVDNNQIQVNGSAKDLVGENYKKVVSQLKDSGFTNIQTEKIEDLITGLLTKDGEIKKITIGGVSDFSDGNKFSKDVKITITYHTFESESSHSITNESSAEKPVATNSIEENEDNSTENVSNKLDYTVTKKEDKNIITGDIAMTGGDGHKVIVNIGNDSIKPGTYIATWTPGVFGGSDPDFGYGLIYINGDPNTIQLIIGEPMTVTFNESDTITFQFAGKGENDRIRLNQE